MIRILAALALATAVPASAQLAPPPVVIPVTTAPSLGAHQSGRIIVFAKKLADPGKPDTSVGFDVFTPSAASIAAREVSDLEPARPAMVDAETDAFPGPFSTLAAGTYELQAVLDRNHDYNYSGRGAGDLVSKVVTVSLPGPVPTLTLEREVAAPDDTEAFLNNAPREYHDTLLEWAPKLKAINFQSTKMTAFRGTPTFIRGWVALPPGYDGTTRFPTVYADGGFGSSLIGAKAKAAIAMAEMAKGETPPMIWVYLDHSGVWGVHEFADSANNGPWGSALTTELIPWLERQYAMDARPSGRFLTGHSSGGWSALWLQVRYPKMFGGSWPTSPDPSDFHDLVGINIYAPNANAYRDPSGAAYPLARDGGKQFITIEEFTRSEAAIGHSGGQMESFDNVFSPRGADGQPIPLIDRATGNIDPAVAAYWRDNYDIANILKRDWPSLKRDLDGKIHLTVGTADTFYLDGPAHRLEAVMKGLGAKTDFRYLPGKTHFDLYERGGDQMALLKDIAWEIYAVARPKSKRPSR
jgi:S-formylglutathione hydrolase FrmB